MNHAYKSAFLDLTIAAQRLNSARLQLANAWAQVPTGHEPQSSNAGRLCKDADEVQNRLTTLTDTVRHAWVDRERQ